MLRSEHLYKSFDQKKNVIKDLNLEVRDGSIFGLVGVNGAGKSTLLRMIAGVYAPDGGAIFLNEEDLHKNPSLRKHIAFAADEPYCPMGSTIQSLRVLYESMYDFDGTWFDQAVNAFELDRNQSLAGFSKGMKRRMSILFALSIHPKVLLMDEAYDGLEPLARLQVKKMLAERLEEEKMSVIISSHSLRELEEICDSFGILENGTLLSYGDLQEKKRLVNKYQIAFETEPNKEMFQDLDLLSCTIQGRIVFLLARGEKEEVIQKLNQNHPVLLDVLPVSFEELFMSEVEEGRKHE